MTSCRGTNTQCCAERMLALIFFLCLAIAGVVGDLTDADFVKIGSLLDKRDERLYSELGTLKSTIDALETKFDAKFDALETKFDALETKFDALNISVGAQIGDLKTYVATAFSDYYGVPVLKYNALRCDAMFTTQPSAPL